MIAVISGGAKPRKLRCAEQRQRNIVAVGVSDRQRLVDANFAVCRKGIAAVQTVRHHLGAPAALHVANGGVVQPAVDAHTQRHAWRAGER